MDRDTDPVAEKNKNNVNNNRSVQHIKEVHQVRLFHSADIHMHAGSQNADMLKLGEEPIIAETNNCEILKLR